MDGSVKRKFPFHGLISPAILFCSIRSIPQDNYGPVVLKPEMEHNRIRTNKLRHTQHRKLQLHTIYQLS